MRVPRASGGTGQGCGCAARAREAAPGRPAREAAAGHARSAAHLGDVGAGDLAEGGDAIDARDALREEGVRRELRQLRAPQVGRQHLRARHPPPVHVGEALHRRVPRGGLGAADKDAVRLEEVVDGRALRQELGVGEHLVRVGGGLATRLGSRQLGGGP